MRHTADTPPDKLRLIVPDAARALGISPEAIRNRLSRGTLQSERHGGTVHVLIDRDMVRHADDTPPDTPGDRDALVAELRARIDSLERQLDQERQANGENRRIIMALTSKVPELEAAQGTTESPQGATESPAGGTPPPGPQKPAQRPWWRRVVGR